jgi:transposase
MYSIGLDISKSSVNVYIPKTELDLVIDNSVKAFKSLYSKLKKLYKKEIDKVVFVFEPTGNYSTPLHRFCAEKEITSFIIGPKESRNFAKAIAQRNKTDIVDARVLSKAIVIARPDQIQVPNINERVEEIKELMTYYKLKLKIRVQLSNHLEALKAKQINITIMKRLESEIRLLKVEEENLINDMYLIIEADEELVDKYDSIISIDGIGKVSAIILLHLFIRYPDANQRQIISLTGLDPIMKESGTSVRGKSKISKAGARIYRGTLFMATMSATLHNEKMITFYERLKAN